LHAGQKRNARLRRGDAEVEMTSDKHESSSRPIVDAFVGRHRAAEPGAVEKSTINQSGQDQAPHAK